MLDTDKDADADVDGVRGSTGFLCIDCTVLPGGRWIWASTGLENKGVLPPARGHGWKDGWMGKVAVDPQTWRV